MASQQHQTQHNGLRDRRSPSTDGTPTSCEDASNKYRCGAPFDGPHPDDLTAEQLRHINTRWEQFFRQKKGLIDSLAGDDADLASIAMLGVRGTLARLPDCPQSWLVAQAKYDIKSARRWGGCIDSRRRHDWRYDPVHRTDNQPFEDKADYAAHDAMGTFDSLKGLFDQMSYNPFYGALSDMERALLELLKEEAGQGGRWYGGEYIPVVRKRVGAYKRFLNEVSSSVKDYMTSYVNLRFQFYNHFGTDEEIAFETQWVNNWAPYQSLHASRTGKYQRTCKDANPK